MKAARLALVALAIVICAASAAPKAKDPVPGKIKKLHPPCPSTDGALASACCASMGSGLEPFWDRFKKSCSLIADPTLMRYKDGFALSLSFMTVPIVAGNADSGGMAVRWSSWSRYGFSYSKCNDIDFLADDGPVAARTDVLRSDFDFDAFGASESILGYLYSTSTAGRSRFRNPPAR